jgi:hypothetical protein
MRVILAMTFGILLSACGGSEADKGPDMTAISDMAVAHDLSPDNDDMCEVVPCELVKPGHKYTPCNCFPDLASPN